jgi:GGDEF domain-containing protein
MPGSHPPRRRRARPVADAPVDILVTEAQSIAKGWLLALLETAPLGQAETVPVADFAAGAPALCAAIARSLSSDAEMARLEPAGDLVPLAASAGRLAGAVTPTETLEAVEALRGVMWSAIRAEIYQEPEPDLVAEVAERLQRVCALVASAAVGAAAGERPAEERPTELAEAPAAPVEGGEWREALAEQLESARRANDTLALLLIEIEDAERLRAAGGGQTLSRVVRAVRGEVRRPDVIALEEDGRVWVIAPGMSRQAGAGMSQRVLTAVGTVEHRRVPLLATVGLAVFPEDGRDAETLAAAAEEELLAARAENVRIAGGGGGDEPPRPDLRPVS